MAMDLSKLKNLEPKRGGIGNGLLSSVSREENFGTKTQIQYIHVSKLVPNDKNFYSQEEIEDRAESIEQVGQLVPMRVVPIEDGKYRIYSGESRYRAITLLYERGKSEGYAECIVDDFEDIKQRVLKKSGVELSDDEIERLMIIEPNAQTRDYTEVDKMNEAAEKRELYTKLKRKGIKEVMGMELKGKVRDIVAQSMGVSSTQAGQYLAVADKGVDELKGIMEDDTMKIDAAYTVAQEPENIQRAVVEEIKNTGKEKITKKEVENIIEKKKNNEQTPELVPEVAENEVYLTIRDWKMDVKFVQKALKNGIILEDDAYDEYRTCIQKLKELFSVGV